MNHQRIDERSLAFGRLIAAKLPQEPWVLDKARENLARWQTSCSADCAGVLQEWQRIVEGPVHEVIRVLTSPDEAAAWLRQSSPFAGVLTTAERNAVIREFAQ